MKKTKLSLVMAALCLIFNASAQQIYFLKGRVVTTDQRPLPGATIKQEKAAVFTNNDGYFNISTSKVEGKLNISYMGYKPKEVQFSKNESGPFLITLEPDRNNDLSEVQINAGYYTVKDKERTGSISRVTAETISKQPVSNPLSALIGRMPGVDIQQQNGLPGSNFTVRIRGRNSLRNDGNEPLYLVDGISIISNTLSSGTTTSPYLNGMSALSTINPADIESIEVLKDADATAIYGSRGANGVVLITTKKGKEGKANVSFNFSQGIGKVAEKIKLLNTAEYLEMRNESFKNDGLKPTLLNSPDLLHWDQSRYTDWQKVLIGGTANYTNLQTALSGGSNATQFLARFGFSNDGTVFPDKDKYLKGSGLLNVNHISSNQRLTAGFSINYMVDQNNIASTDYTRLALTLAPNAPALYDTSGKLNWQESTWDNPIAALRRKYTANTNNLIANGNIAYSFSEHLKLKTTFGYTKVSMDEVSILPISSRNPEASSPASMRLANIQSGSWIVEPQINYIKSTGKGSLNVLIGSTFQSRSQNLQAFSGSGYTNDALLGNIKAAPTFSVVDANYIEYRYLALFSRINYSWDEKYIVNLTGRRDGSSRFGKDRQFANFGAAGLTWIFTNENFIKNNETLSFGKLRASYGITGSDQIGDYGFMDTYLATDYPYQGGTGLIPTRLANPDYSWEVNRKLEAALELGFFKDQLRLSLTAYRNRSSNQLVGYALSQVTGFPSIQYNLPATLQNSGFEMELNSTMRIGNEISWNTNLNLTIPKSKLISYPNLINSSYAGIYKEGASLNLKRTYRYLGVDATTGLYTFEDVGQNNSYSLVEDGQFLKEVGRSVFGGWSNSFKYKSFELDFLFQFAKQQSYDSTSGAFSRPGTGSNQPVDVLKRWQNVGDVTSVQKFTTTGTSYTRYGTSDQAIVDASFIKLKNVALAYSLKGNLAQSLKLNSCKFFLQGQNLFTISNYIADPENSNIMALPPLQTLVAGIQITL